MPTPCPMGFLCGLPPDSQTVSGADSCSLRENIQDVLCLFMLSGKTGLSWSALLCQPGKPSYTPSRGGTSAFPGVQLKRRFMYFFVPS